jgi:hypothetical protein
MAVGLDSLIGVVVTMFSADGSQVDLIIREGFDGLQFG